MIGREIPVCEFPMEHRQALRYLYVNCPNCTGYNQAFWLGTSGRWHRFTPSIWQGRTFEEAQEAVYRKMDGDRTVIL